MNNKLRCILFIDDDEPTNFFNKMTTEQSGCTDRVEVFQSGQEALDYLVGPFPSPDLIFLDINMPAMDGWEFLDMYKTLPRADKAKIVLVMLTTSLNPDDEAKTRDIEEVAGFEYKPLMESRLGGLLKKYFPHIFPDGIGAADGIPSAGRWQ
jgi:CheY-like chemotaxis protein